MNPLDEYMEMKKEAFFGAAKQWLGRAITSKPAQDEFGKKFMGGLATAGGAAIVGAGAMAVNKIRGSISRNNDFRAMMQADPELRDIQKERPQFFNQAYNSLRRVNPTFGSDPIIAGGYMRKMMANPDAAGLTLAQTVKSPGFGEPPGFRAEIGPFKIGM